jgi:coenzyme F420-reducing hydrogenase delta subunit
MKEVKILGICCNWSPFACYNAAGMAQMKMPDNFRLIRVMCIGRINQALILRAFEYGADGVILLECKDEDCRYGPGPEVGHENIKRVRRLLHLLGIRQERLIERNFGAHERSELASALRDFAGAVDVLGPLTSSDRTDAEDGKAPKDAAI